MLLDRARPCAGCRGTGGPLCPSCRRALAVGPRVVDRGDALPLPVVASAVYAGPVREALVAFKDHGRWALREPLGRALTLAVCELVELRVAELLAALGVPDGMERDPAEPVDPADPGLRFLLVPAPSAAANVRLRDGDHVGELAHEVERLAGARFLEAVPGLVVVRRRRDQVGLARAQRSANLHGSMGATDALVRRAARPRTAVIVVDDLVTTGATLAEADRALRAAGIRPWGAAVVAATPDLGRRPVPRRRPGVR